MHREVNTLIIIVDNGRGAFSPGRPRAPEERQRFARFAQWHHQGAL